MFALRRVLSFFVVLLALFLLGTVLVLATVRAYFGIDYRDLISPNEVDIFEASPSLPYNASAPSAQLDGMRTAASSSAAPAPLREKVPRIIHQTWKTENIPEKWKVVRENCLAMHPDFEFVLWTDASAREFIDTHYHWFIPTYDSYPFNIQRADAMRYFILHHYGGVYIDLDIGCKRPIEPLLNFDLILARTIPVGVSNDLMFSAPRHPFMNFLIHNLVTFNHQYGTSYPTIMFSTGPMYVSLQYNLWRSSSSEDVPLNTASSSSSRDIRILPKELYGKNALPEESEHAFFWHFYGSSWHTDDATFVTFLGRHGMILMRLGAVVVCIGAILILWRRGVSSITPRVVSAQLPFSPIVSDGRGWAGLLATSRSRPSTPLSASGKRSRSTGLYYFLPLWYFSSSSSSSSLSPTPSGMSTPSSSSWAQTPTSPSNTTRKFASYLSNMTSSRGYPILPTEEPPVSLRPLKINVDVPSDGRYSDNSDSPSSPGTASKPFAYGNSRHNWFRRRRSSSATLPIPYAPSESSVSARSSPPAYSREDEHEAATRCCRRQQSKDSYKDEEEQQ